ncbi:very large low complexity protein [Purpureocillium lavendulum]|uniref:Very large low complexity protein n=1 Tax=Purpureocillium lavendulum TaxID=1247861 RepID=A0AB34G4S9_9HYPO|nr:very large low complexity protein [Purpureocillium lavendulum]
MATSMAAAAAASSAAVAAAVAAAPEKLSVTTAIIGLLAVGGRTIDAIWDLNLPATKATPFLNQALQEIKQARSTVHILYKTFALLESAQLPFPERGTWIAVDDLIATLTDTVLAFSDLQALCAQLEAQRQGLVLPDGPAPLCNGGDAECGQKITALCARIRWHNLSMTMMMTILKWRLAKPPGLAPDEPIRPDGAKPKTVTGLTADHMERAAQVKPTPTTPGWGWSTLDDVFDEGGINRESLPHYTPPARHRYHAQQSPYSVPARSATTSSPSPPLSSSPPPPGSDDITPVPSSPTRARVQTPLSGYTLAGIPVLSIIPLPITIAEIFDGPDVYTFAYARRVSRDLGELMQCQAGQGTTRSLGVVLGRSANAHPNAAGSFSTGGSSNSTAGTNSIGACEPAVLQEPSPPPQDDRLQQQQEQQPQDRPGSPVKKKKLRFRKIVNVKHRWRAF